MRLEGGNVELHRQFVLQANINNTVTADKCNDNNNHTYCYYRVAVVWAYQEKKTRKYWEKPRKADYHWEKAEYHREKAGKLRNTEYHREKAEKYLENWLSLRRNWENYHLEET